MIGSQRSSRYLRNWAPAGPNAIIRLASPSSSARGGGACSFCGLTRRQVMRVGAAHVLGGMMTRKPLCRLPRMEPPRASTMKLTRNLRENKREGSVGKHTDRKATQKATSPRPRSQRSLVVSSPSPPGVGLHSSMGEFPPPTELQHVVPTVFWKEKVRWKGNDCQRAGGVGRGGRQTDGQTRCSWPLMHPPHVQAA